jgi:hexosaminidase
MLRLAGLFVVASCGVPAHVSLNPTAPAVIPQPRSIQTRDGAFRFSRDTALVAAGEAAEPATVLAEQLAPALGAAPRVVPVGDGSSTVAFVIDASLATLGAEGYRLAVRPTGVEIRASGAAGLFYGAQTLRQLLPPDAFAKHPAAAPSWLVPAVDVEDAPRFAWRGALVDPARNFLTIAELEDFIDLIALHKLDVLHIHLTDDQGWRIEIKKYPALTEVGGRRAETVIGRPWDHDPPAYDGKPHVGFYSQTDIRTLVEFARRRHVTLLPEIEMPGHTQAAVAAYPELGSTDKRLAVCTTFGVQDNILAPTDRSIAFMQDVLVEVMELFPSPYIHIGGDEAKKDQWRTNPEIQTRLHALGLKDENELQAWLTTQMDKFLTAHGRRLVGWDEILEGGLSPNATVMSWRGEDGGISAASAGHDVVMAPAFPTYLDSCQTPDQSQCKHEPLAQDNYVTLDHLLAYDPVPAKLPADKRAHVLGAQAAIWGEFTPSYQRVSYQAWPRLAAFAEAVWSVKEVRDKQSFLLRLREHLRRLDAAGVERFRKADP